MKEKNDTFLQSVIERGLTDFGNFLVNIEYPQMYFMYLYIIFFSPGRFLSDHVLEARSLAGSNNLPSLQTEGKTDLPCTHLPQETYKATSFSS